MIRTDSFTKVEQDVEPYGPDYVRRPSLPPEKSFWYFRGPDLIVKKTWDSRWLAYWRGVPVSMGMALAVLREALSDAEFAAAREALHGVF